MKCDFTFNRGEAKQIMLNDPILNRQYPEDICPNCEQWLSNCQTYYKDGSVATRGGGSAIVTFKKGMVWPE